MRSNPIKNLIIILICYFLQTAYSNNSINYVTEDPWTIIESNERTASVFLDKEKFQNFLEKTIHINKRLPSTLAIQLPLYNGGKKAFKVYQTSIMHPNLAARYPNIRSYIGIGVENPFDRASIVLYDNIIIGMMITESGERVWRILFQII